MLGVDARARNKIVGDRKRNWFKYQAPLSYVYDWFTRHRLIPTVPRELNGPGMPPRSHIEGSISCVMKQHLPKRLHRVGASYLRMIRSMVFSNPH